MDGIVVDSSSDNDDPIVDSSDNDDPTACGFDTICCTLDTDIKGDG